MCGVAAIAVTGIVLSLATTIYQTEEQRKLASRERFRRIDLQEREAAIAQENALIQYSAVQRRSVEESQAASQAINEDSRRAAAARSTARTGAGEAGGFGQSFDALLGNYNFLESQFQDTVQSNFGFVRRQAADDLRLVRLGFASNLLATRRGPLQGPDYVGASLRLASSVTSSLAPLASVSKGNTSTATPSSSGTSIRSSAAFRG